MLYFQKASAGSGKTYKLTEKFIRLLLSYPAEDGSRRLMPASKFTPNHPKVLAITFTNKAAQEMKDRIIEALSALAYDVPGKDTTYLATFMEEFGVSESEVRATSLKALDELLNNYTDFNVSTIDAFFQRVLRSFAYEIDLSNNFRLEVNNSMVNAMAVDATLSEHKESDGNDQVSKWIRDDILRSASGGQSYNVYSETNPFISEIHKFLRVTGDESFADIEDVIKDFFRDNTDFYENYTRLTKEWKGNVKEKLDTLKEQARSLNDFLDSVEGKDYSSSNFRKYLAALTRLTFGKKYGNKLYDSTSGLKKGFEAMGAANVEYIERGSNELVNAINAYHTFLSLRDLYHRFMPALALYVQIDANRKKYCEENNIFLLSDTNILLEKIINDDDAPFIYEKIGSFIEHFLIDEFQDTSRRQWKIISPLFKESLSNGKFNMIIGDAKQSIYRFRNADPTIISETVPAQFADSLDVHGITGEENSNYRSFPAVVEFNNTIFSIIAKNKSYEPDYLSVAQWPRVDKGRGYVECRFVQSEDSSEYKEVVSIIRDLVNRGYRQRDIAILARWKSELEESIKAIDLYNSECEQSQKIRYLSNEALLVKSAKSVRMAISVLRLLAGGTTVQEADSNNRKILKLTGPMLSSLISYVLISKEEVKSLQDALKEVADIERPEDELAEMLGSMRAMTLPALVENVFKYFVEESHLASEAQYIASFMDKVVEWSEHYGSSLSPFLRYWDEISSTLAIVAPDGEDAVKLMTIHKSKGLEFKAVIFLTYRMNDSFSTNKLPKCWVKPSELYDADNVLPPGVLVELKDGCVHPEAYNYALQELLSDNINLAYVAATRGKEEVYILSRLGDVEMKKSSAEPPATVAYSILDALQKIEDGEEISRYGIDRSAFTKEDCNAEEDDVMVFTYGEKPESVNNREEDNDSPSMLEISGYHINTNLNMLNYQEEDLRVDEEDKDPRSMGNMMHLVMSRIKYIDDFPQAIKILGTRGLASESVASQINEIIAEALKSRVAKKWFDKSLRVINERTLIGGGKEYHRPDRIVVDKEGNATVIDFKFGEYANLSKYRRQVKKYVEILKATGDFTSVTGYLWYVMMKKVYKIE